MRILISNDDGVHALGLKILFNEIKKIADCWVVAPLQEKSTTGHSLTIHKPLRMIELEKNVYGVSGSPADCINLGLKQVLKKKPDFVISGINRGANLGQDIYYSGTVSAAREACIHNVPSIAVSLAVDFSKSKPEAQYNYRAAARMTVKLIRSLKAGDIPEHSLLNLNVPDLPFAKIKGLRPARMGFRHYDGDVVRRLDHRGKFYYWLGGHYRGFRKDENTDCHIVDQGFASLTPLKLDATDLSLLARLSHKKTSARAKASR